MVTITPFGITFIVIAAVMVVSTIIQFHRKRITSVWAMFWSSIWIIGAVMMFFTGTLDAIGQYLLGVEARMAAIYVAIFILLVMVYRLVLALNEVRRDLSRIVEELAKRKK